MVKVISGTDLVSGTIQTPLTMAGRQFHGEGERYYIGQTIAPAGDVNGDGDTDGADLGILLSLWGPCQP